MDVPANRFFYSGCVVVSDSTCSVVVYIRPHRSKTAKLEDAHIFQAIRRPRHSFAVAGLTTSSSRVPQELWTKVTPADFIVTFIINTAFAVVGERAGGIIAAVIA